MMESYEEPSAPAKIRGFVCVECKHDLKKPFQLSKCLHLVCYTCLDNLTRGVESNAVICPQCKIENVDPKVLQRISGINLKSPDGDERICGKCYDNVAQWACFDCNEYLCRNCRTRHDRDHSLYLLSSGFLSLSSPGESSTDQADSELSIPCPLCETNPSCSHKKLLEDLTAPVNDAVGDCDSPFHVEQTLRFFCLEEDEAKHWRPICGDCSYRGDHKPCKATDLPKLRPYINGAIKLLKNRIDMLLVTTKEELRERSRVEDGLRRHVKDIEHDISNRQKRIMHHLSQALERVVAETKQAGDDILDRYRSEVQPWQKLEPFVATFRNSVNSLVLAVDDPQVGIPKYVNSFKLLKRTFQVVDELEYYSKTIGVNEDRRLDELRLVLPSVPDQLSIPPLLSMVGSENRHPRLAFSLSLNIEFSIDSFVVTSKGECIYTEKRMNRDHSIMVRLWIDSNDTQHTQDFSIDRGRYHIALMKSGEIVASREHERGYDHGNHFDIVYCPGIEGQHAQQPVATFTPFFERPDPLGGIAVTADNLVFVCVDLSLDGKKADAASYLLLLSLQGKVIKGSPCILHSPKYVAVSEFGEIAVSDPDDHCVVIFDRDLNLVQRVQYSLPTSMNCTNFDCSDKRYFFCPVGLCYDCFGRIIVTDPSNHSVLRLFRNAEDKYVMEPLLMHRQDLTDFVGPRLVAIGPNQKLWVVCKRRIFVFDYQCF